MNSFHDLVKDPADPTQDPVIFLQDPTWEYYNPDPGPTTGAILDRIQ